MQEARHGKDRENKILLCSCAPAPGESNRVSRDVPDLDPLMAVGCPARRVTRPVLKLTKLAHWDPQKQGATIKEQQNLNNPAIRSRNSCRVGYSTKLNKQHM
jgi:hypothetical protein